MLGFHDRVDNFSDFPCSLLISYLVQYIFLVKNKNNELSFLYIEDFNFLWKGRNARFLFLMEIEILSLPKKVVSSNNQNVRYD